MERVVSWACGKGDEFTSALNIVNNSNLKRFHTGYDVAGKPTPLPTVIESGK